MNMRFYSSDDVLYSLVHIITSVRRCLTEGFTIQGIRHVTFCKQSNIRKILRMHQAKRLNIMPVSFLLLLMLHHRMLNHEKLSLTLFLLISLFFRCSITRMHCSHATHASLKKKGFWIDESAKTPKCMT